MSTRSLPHGVSKIHRIEDEVKTDPETFIRANTAFMAPPHVPEIRLHWQQRPTISG